MIKKVAGPTVVKAAGNKEKIIEEYFGMVNSSSRNQRGFDAQPCGLD